EALVDPGSELRVHGAEVSPALPGTGGGPGAAEQGRGTAAISRAPGLTGTVQQRGGAGAVGRTGGVTSAAEQGRRPVGIAQSGGFGGPNPQRKRRGLSGRGAPELRRLQLSPWRGDRGRSVGRRGERRGSGGRQRKRRGGRGLRGHATNWRRILSLPLDAVEKRHPLFQPTCLRYLLPAVCSA